MRQVALIFLLLSAFGLAASDPYRSDRSTNDPVLISLKWLLDGQVAVRGTDEAGKRWTEDRLLSLRAHLKKRYPRTIPVVLGDPGSKQPWVKVSDDRRSGRKTARPSDP